VFIGEATNTDYIVFGLTDRCSYVRSQMMHTIF